MGDHHHRHAHFFNDVDQLELGLFAQLFVQCAQGFVEQQELGLFRQAAGQGHALLLTTRELVRLAFGVRRELHQGQHLVGAFLNFVFGQAFALETKGDVLPNVEVGKQRIRLEHHVDRAVVGRHGRHVLTTEQDAPRRGLLKAREHAQQGRLATTRTAQQRKDLALADRQRDLIDRHRVIKTLDQFFGNQIPRLRARLCHS